MLWTGFLFKRRYAKLIPVLQRGHTSELRALLWQPRGLRIDYSAITLSLLQKFQTPPGEQQPISVARVYSTWNFDLVLFNLPSKQSEIPYEPLLFYRRQMKAVGVMMPFNELSPYLTKKAKDQIFRLSKTWIFLTMAIRSQQKR